MRTDLSIRPVTGYGLTFYRDQDNNHVCAFLDGSPVLAPSRIERDGGSRRFRFTEGSRELRQAGDIFCADAETAGLVREALNEKLERDRDNSNAFRVVSANPSRRQRYLFLYAVLANINTGAINTIDFTLEAPNSQVEREGRAEFGRFLTALGLASIDDTDELLSRTATFELFGERRVFKKWSA